MPTPVFANTPIAIAFLEEPPAAVPRWDAGAVPAGCSFWRAAMGGKTFYTLPSDHYNCAIGAHTHAIPQPAGRETVLPETVGLMVSQGYIDMAEVPGIPVLPKTPGVVAYGPAASVPFPADLVVLAAKPAEAMLVYEAALRAGVAGASTSVLGRPGCAVLPLTKESGTMSLSFGCRGNRIFTGLPDEEMYVCVPGDKWESVSGELAGIETANAAMAAHYQMHRSQFPILNS